MRHNKLSLFYHLVWSTWDRAPLITPDIEKILYREIEHEVLLMKCKVLAIGGIEDHVHLLLEMPPTISVSQSVKQIKGASSLFVNDTLRPTHKFKWQASYAAFSVSRWDTETIIGYIGKQKEHHAAGTLNPLLELSSPLGVLSSSM